MEQLVPSEKARLDELEVVIEQGMATFVQVGQALLEIRDSRLYRQMHATFEDYCRRRWGWSRRHANRTIEAAAVAAVLGPMGPTNERQARELAPLIREPWTLHEAWQEAEQRAADNGSTVTAELLSQVVWEKRDAATTRRPVTYKHQPAIDATHGNVPIEGTSHLYRVNKLLWPEQVEAVLVDLLIPRSLHVCCGASKLGDIRLDSDDSHAPDLVADATQIPLDDDAVESVLCDPPYNGEFQWNHDLLAELARVARKRIIFQHWFIPANPDGRYKKAQDKFALSDIFVWQPKTYFGRAQLISVFDATG